MAAQIVPCSKANPAQPGVAASTYVLCMGGAGIMHNPRLVLWQVLSTKG